MVQSSLQLLQMVQIHIHSIYEGMYPTTITGSPASIQIHIHSLQGHSSLLFCERTFLLTYKLLYTTTSMLLSPISLTPTRKMPLLRVIPSSVAPTVTRHASEERCTPALVTSASNDAKHVCIAQLVMQNIQTSHQQVAEWDYECKCDNNLPSHKFVLFTLRAYSAIHSWALSVQSVHEQLAEQNLYTVFFIVDSYCPLKDT